MQMQAYQPVLCGIIGECWLATQFQHQMSMSVFCRVQLRASGMPELVSPCYYCYFYSSRISHSLCNICTGELYESSERCLGSDQLKPLLGTCTGTRTPQTKQQNYLCFL